MKLPSKDTSIGKFVLRWKGRIHWRGGGTDAASVILKKEWKQPWEKWMFCARGNGGENGKTTLVEERLCTQSERKVDTTKKNTKENTLDKDLGRVPGGEDFWKPAQSTGS